MSFPKNLPQILLAVACVVLGGCKPEQFGTVTKLSGAEAAYQIVEFSQSASDHAVALVAGTSMEPYIKAGDWALCTRYVNQESTPLKAGMLVRFDRGDIKDVMHAVIEVCGAFAYISATNNSRSDGWFPLSSVRFIVVEVIRMDSSMGTPALTEMFGTSPKDVSS